MSGKTYKAIWTCEETNEREVWYVGSRQEAQRMVNQHTKNVGGKLLKQYRKTTMRLIMKPMFGDGADAGYDTNFFGWAGH